MDDDDSAEGSPLETKALLSEQSVLGLSPTLWRLALVIGVGQFAWSIWGWQFSIYLRTVPLLEWQLGLTFSIATFATLLGFPISGFIADMIGRRKTIALAFIPMIAGLFLIAWYPVWPFIPLFHSLTSFGWSFVLITSRAAPADEIARDGGRDSARRFTMVLMPAFLVDGISPAIAGALVGAGLNPKHLLVLGGIGACVAFLVAFAFVKESLDTDIQIKARAGPKISFRRLGRNFWILAAGMLFFYFSFNMPMMYLGNLIVEEWFIDIAIYGFVWSSFSLTSVLLMYTISGFADKHIKSGLFLSIIANSIILWAFGISSGIVMLIFLNVIWALPVMVWIGTERSLIVEDVDEEMKGRALGMFQVMMASTNLVAAPAGAWIWASTGSLRFLFTLGAGLGLISAIVLGIALLAMRSPKQFEITEGTQIA